MDSGTQQQIAGTLGLGAFRAIMMGAGRPKGKLTNVIAVFVLGILTIFLSYTLAEAGKVLLRKNFGRSGITLIWLVLAVIIFFTIGGFCIGLYWDFDGSSQFGDLGSRTSFLVAGILYIVLAFLMISKAVKTSNLEYIGDAYDLYRGDSAVLANLYAGGWKQDRIQNIAEPLFLIAAGFFISSINVLGGVPIICCGIGMWIQYILEAAIGFVKSRNILSNEGHEFYQTHNFSEAKN